MRRIKFRALEVETGVMHDPAFPSWNGTIEVWEDNIPQSKIKYLHTGGPEDEGILEQFVDGKWEVIGR